LLLLSVALWLFGSSTGPAHAAAEVRELVIGYLSIADDPRHAERRSYANIVLRPAVRPFDGARTALREGRILGRALKIKFRLEQAEVADGGALLPALERLREQAGARLFLVDAPGPAVAGLAAATRGRGLLLVNVSAPDDELRAAACQQHLLHTMPSRSMLADALAQYLVKRNWRRVMLLQGPLPEDQATVTAFRRTARKFGIKIVQRRDFIATNDPRQRDRNNILLLTAGPAHDAVFVADARRDFARYIAYQTAEPRLVIGDAGLGATAWHWAWERHGAPQLNQRFERLAKRRMSDPDWAAWAAVRAIIEAAARAATTDFEPLVAYLKGPKLALDGYKGTPANFRPWNGQLRQPLLLANHDAVLTRAPLEGFLHPTSYLDTLGAEAAESGCGG
jgi:ABC transporter substrate binding protein (PQQ-dependent alcohol dehydrogenase system)